MADSYIQVPTDGSGKKVRTQEITVGLNTVHQHYFILSDSSGVEILPATEDTLDSLNSKVTVCNTGAVTIAALPNEGQQTMANSISVVLASDQTEVPVTVNGPPAALSGAVTVSTTAVQLIVSSDQGVTITNNGVGDLYIGVDNTVTTSGAKMGLVVYPGGSFSLLPFEWEGAVWGIYSTTASSQNVSVFNGGSD